MKKDNKAPPNGQHVLQPTSVETNSVYLHVNIPDRYVYITALNVDGTEKAGSGFFYPERNARKIYGDITRYSIKKIKTITIKNHHHYETLNRTSQQITRSIDRRCNSCGG